MTKDGYHIGIDTSGTADITYMSSTASSATGQHITPAFSDEVDSWPSPPPPPRNRAERRKRKKLRAGYTRRSPWKKV